VNWRLILDGEYSGAWNMARDEALLLCQDESTPLVLRFYSWNPACVSLGRLQKNFDFSRLKSTSFDVVRRPTGGRAVLHQHEITYCAVIHEQHLPRESRSVIGAYEWLSAGFIAGLESLGVRAQLSPARCKDVARSAAAAVNCFNAAAQCDFLVDGRKLIGAAQCRKEGVILQHGALLLEVDEAAWQSALGAMEGAVSLRSLGVLASREEIIAALCRGMERTRDTAFERSVLSRAEHQVASRLHAHKYSSPAWNERGQSENR
jgi:lipoate-protein ligase A